MSNGFEEIEVEKFKKLIKDMYKGFPNWVYHERLISIINKDMIDHLVENKFLIKWTPKDPAEQRVYSLGVNALPLVSSWQIEVLTSWLIVLTIVLLILTIKLLPS